MIVAVLFIGLFLFVSWISVVHAMGLLLALMILHGVLVLWAGESTIHLPLFAGAIILAAILATGTWRKPGGSIIALFAVLILAMCMAAFAGLDQANSLFWLVQYAKGFLLALLVAGIVRSEHDIKLLTLYCLAAVVIGASLTAYQHMTGAYAISTIYEQRASGLTGDPNDTAMLLIIGIPLAWYWFTKSPHIVLKAIFFSALLLLLISVMLTGSRGGFVTLALLAFVIYLKRPTFSVTIIGLVMAGVLTAVVPHAYWDRVETLVAGKDQHGGASLGNRAKLLLTGLEIFSENPLLGVGSGNFGLAFATHGRGGSVRNLASQHLSSQAGKFGVAHNLHLEFFVEHGVVAGFILWAIFCRALSNLVRYVEVRGDDGGNHFHLGFSLALALGGMLFAGLFLSQGKNPVLWFLVGMGFAVVQVAGKEKPRTVCDSSTETASTPGMVFPQVPYQHLEQ